MESKRRAGRIRAFRCEEAEAQVERRLAALALLFTDPGDIERALRDARRAGRTGALHYDPARHAALARLWRAQGAGIAGAVTGDREGERGLGRRGAGCGPHAEGGADARHAAMPTGPGEKGGGMLRPRRRPGAGPGHEDGRRPQSPSNRAVER